MPIREFCLMIKKNMEEKLNKRCIPRVRSVKNMAWFNVRVFKNDEGQMFQMMMYVRVCIVCEKEN